MMNTRTIGRTLSVSLVLGALLPIAACVRKPEIKVFPKDGFVWVKIHWTKNLTNEPLKDVFVGCVVVDNGVVKVGDVAVTVNDEDVGATTPPSAPNLALAASIEAELVNRGCIGTIVCYESDHKLLSDSDSVETIYSLTDNSEALTSVTTCGGGTNVGDPTLTNFSFYTQSVPLDTVVLPLCDGNSGNLGCGAGCTADACDAACDDLIATSDLDEVTNLNTIDLALVQQDFKINKFQQWAREILKKRGVQTQLIKSIADVKAAVAAKPGRNVAIFGHGNTGEIKIGEEVLNKANATDFGNLLKGQVKTLTLFGCKTGANQQFLKDLTAALQRPVHAWEGKVYAFGNDEGIPPQRRNRFFTDPGGGKKDIPTVSEWGMVVMGLLVLTAGTVVMMRRRTVPA